jgi:hypothetical protein
MLHRKKETEGNTELSLQSPRRRGSQQQLQDSHEGSAEFNLPMSPRRSPRQAQETRGSTEFNLVSPSQRSQKNRSSFSTPRTKNEHAHPPLPPSPAGGERRSSFKAAMKTLASPVKKAGDMLSGSFRNLNSPKMICEEEEDEDDEAEEFKKENNDLTLMLPCRELELLSD